MAGGGNQEGPDSRELRLLGQDISCAIAGLLVGQLHDADRFLCGLFRYLIDRAPTARREPIEMVKWRFGRRKAPDQSSQADAVLPPTVPVGTRVYAIGDIHGRSDLLDQMRALIEADFRANPVPDPQVVYLGDYVDRGPDSAGVLDRLAGGGAIGKARLLSGNHEQMLLHFLEDEASGIGWWQLGGLETLRSYGVIDRSMWPETGVEKLAQEFRSKLPVNHLTLISRTRKDGDHRGLLLLPRRRPTGCAARVPKGGRPAVDSWRLPVEHSRFRQGCRPRPHTGY